VCSGLVQVDHSSQTYELTRDFYALGQFSRFVRKGAVALNGSVSGSSAFLASSALLEITQYLNSDGCRVVVFSHKSPADCVVQLHFASGDTWWGTLPARSVATWVLPPSHVAV
jgi:O-glycosyl hydrolase